MYHIIYKFSLPTSSTVYLTLFDNLKKNAFFLLSLQLRMWSQPDMVNQTLYALGFATKAYEYFTDFFQIPDVVPKAGELMPTNKNWPMQYTEIFFRCKKKNGKFSVERC